MTLQDMKKLGGMIMSFLCLFRGCFPRLEGYRHCAVYVKGQLSDLHRKNCEAIAVEAGVAPRTFPRHLESIKRPAERERERRLQTGVKDHAHLEAIGLIDESGTTKSGEYTSGVGRQYNGNRGKIENCTVGVHLGYWSPQLMTILDSRLYLPEDWANDPQRRKKTIFPMISSFRRSNRLPSA